MKEAVGKYYSATATWVPHELIKNPNRKWWEFWKPRYVWIKIKQKEKIC